MALSEEGRRERKAQNRREANRSFYHRRRSGNPNYALIRQDYDRLLTLAFGDERREKKRKWKWSNKDKVFLSKLRCKFSLTLEQYEDFKKKQNNQCAICSRHPKPNRRLDIDHDHDTGRVRGLLCPECNRMIGMARDSVKILQSAINYIQGENT